MAFSDYEEVRIKATGEKGRICRVNGNSKFHIATATTNYAACYHVELVSTGEIRAYHEAALEAAAG